MGWAASASAYLEGGRGGIEERGETGGGLMIKVSLLGNAESLQRGAVLAQRLLLLFTREDVVFSLRYTTLQPYSTLG